MDGAGGGDGRLRGQGDAGRDLRQDGSRAAACRRAGECFRANYDQCFQGFKRTCCIDANKCQIEPADIDDTDAFLAACVPALESADCAAQKAGVLPSACLMSR